MRVALVGAAEFNESHFVSQRFDYVVAVDAGWQSCSGAGVSADVALGDFDSLGFVPDAPRVVCFDSVKDESDMELALDFALSEGADSVVLYGALSSRLDHTLANIQVMCSCAQRGVSVCGVGGDFAVVVLAGSGEGAESGSTAAPSPFLSFDPFDPSALSGSFAPYFSLFALGGFAEGVFIEGLKYEVSDFSMSPYVSRGLSNQFVGSRAHVTLREGCLAALFPLDALEYASFSNMG